jgi:hypothetical protein
MPQLEQLDLEAVIRSRPEPGRPIVEDDDPRIRELIDLLGGAVTWMTAKQIEEKKPDWAHGDHRVVRALAEKAEPFVIGGNNGYKLTAKVSPVEFAACSRRIRSQAEKMLTKLDALEKFYRNRGQTT